MMYKPNVSLLNGTNASQDRKRQSKPPRPVAQAYVSQPRKVDHSSRSQKPTATLAQAPVGFSPRFQSYLMNRQVKPQARQMLQSAPCMTFDILTSLYFLSRSATMHPVKKHAAWYVGIIYNLVKVSAWARKLSPRTSRKGA